MNHKQNEKYIKEKKIPNLAKKSFMFNRDYPITVQRLINPNVKSDERETDILAQSENFIFR
jgi:hypothetical protein